jgi:hypothetical protein
MSTEHLGEFLHQKVCNMARWIESETRCEGLCAQATSMNNLGAVLLANGINQEREIVHAKDWDALQTHLQNASTLPIVPLLIRACKEVQERPQMHTKFWRYLDMFCEVVS